MSKDKIKILHIGLSSNVGGIESTVKKWWDMIDKTKFKFDFVNLEEKPLAFEEEFIETGCNIFKASSRKDNPIKSYKQIKKIIEQNNYDFVHCHVMSLSWPEPIIITNRVSKSARPIIHIHTMIGKNTPLKRRIIHWSGKVRLANQNYLKFACGYEAGRSVFGTKHFDVIENGIDKEKNGFSSELRHNIRKQYSIKNHVTVIGHVGRLSPEKNYPFIFETFSRYKKENISSLLLLVGVSSEDSFISQQVNKYNLYGSVVCTGRVNNVRDYLCAMDIFYFPSTFEGLSVSLVEAQAVGLPCVASRNVSRESAISENFRFVSIDDGGDEAVRTLNDIIIKSEYERLNSIIKPEYNLENTIRKLENAYFMYRKGE